MVCKWDCNGYLAGVFWGKLTIIKVPKQAPEIWKMMNAKPLTIEICPVSIAAKVTAGLTWPPEMLAVMYTASTTLSGGLGISHLWFLRASLLCFIRHVRHVLITIYSRNVK